MQKRVFLVLSVIILALSISGCRIGPSIDPEERAPEEIYYGYGGLEMGFVRDQPPYKIYDLDVLNILLELRNTGTSDLSGTKCRLYISGFDDSIIRGIDHDVECGSNLEPKTIYNPEGGYDTAQFITDRIDLPDALDVYRPNLLIQACYEYQTIANPVVCIDPQLYSISSIERACTVRDITTAGGQGAPVAVDWVEVRMMKEKVQFKIHVSNVGSRGTLSGSSRTSLGGRGTVLNKQASIYQDCPYNMEFEDYNVIDYDVDMSGASLVKCSPEINGDQRVRLVDDRGLIICTFRISGESAYETPLRIELDYNYLDSISQRIDIIKTPE